MNFQIKDSNGNGRIDLEEVQDWLRENMLTVGIITCFGVAGVSMSLGGGSETLSNQMKVQQVDYSVAQNQDRAERIFKESGCFAQVVDMKTKINNFVSGSVVVDPMSITPTNPEGTRFNGGYACSNDGSIFSIAPNGVVTLIGSSPMIRNTLVEQGFASKSQEMIQLNQKGVPEG